MHIKPGIFLLSTPSLTDPNFDKVVIFIAEYNEKGALGFVVNKLFPRAFNELIEFKQSLAIPLYDGGPVENESLYFLHRRADLITEGTPVTGTVYLGGNFKQAVEHMDHKLIDQRDIKLFIGYCGWDPGQLEEEIDEGSWLLFDADSQTIFADDIVRLWDDIYKGK